MEDFNFNFPEDAFTPTLLAKAIRYGNTFNKTAATIDKWAGLPSLVSSVNGFGPALVALTILEGFPNQFDTIMPYFLFAGCITAFIGLVNGMLERIHSELLKSIRDDYQAITDASYLYIFTLQTIGAIYISADTHFNSHDNNKNHPVEVSNLFFIILASLCTIPAILSIAYNIKNNHHPITNKIAITANHVLEFLITASLVHDICDATTNSDDTSTYTKELISYAVSLMGAGALQYVSYKAPKLATKGMEYLSAINFMIFISEYMNALDHDKTDNNHAIKNSLIGIFVALIIANETFSLRVAIRERSPLRKASLYNFDGLPDVYVPTSFTLFRNEHSKIELSSLAYDEKSPLIINTNPSYGTVTKK